MDWQDRSTGSAAWILEIFERNILVIFLLRIDEIWLENRLLGSLERVLEPWRDQAGPQDLPKVTFLLFLLLISGRKIQQCIFITMEIMK